MCGKCLCVESVCGWKVSVCRKCLWIENCLWMKVFMDGMSNGEKNVLGMKSAWRLQVSKCKWKMTGDGLENGKHSLTNRLEDGGTDAEMD